MRQLLPDLHFFPSSSFIGANGPAVVTAYNWNKVLSEVDEVL